MTEVPTIAARPSLTRRLGLVAALLFVALLAIPSLRYPIARDQATYCVIGQRLLDGQQLYRDLWDNKPPGIFYIYAGIVKVFGTAMWSIGLVDILWLLVISYCLYRFAERYLGTAAALLAVIVHASRHLRSGYWDAVQTEAFMVLLVFLSFLLVVREGGWSRLRHFSAGALLGGAFWMKYNAVGFFPLVFILPYLDVSQLDARPPRAALSIPWNRWLRNAALLTAGFLAVGAGVLGVFWLRGAWPALKEVQFDVLLRYGVMPAQRIGSYWFWALRGTQANLGLWTECATLVALLLAWARRDLRRFGPILFALATGYVVLASQLRFPTFAFESCYPFSAMVWGYLGVTVYEFIRRAALACGQRGWKLARGLVWVVLANLVIWPLPEEIAREVEAYKEFAEWCHDPEGFYPLCPWSNPVSHFRDQMQLIAYLRKTTAPGDGLFVWGSEPLIYFLTGQRCPTRFVSNLGVISRWSPPAWRDELARDLKKSPPRFIVVARNDVTFYVTYILLDSEHYLEGYPQLAQFISEGYSPDEDYKNFAVYRRRGDLQTGSLDAGGK
jgi:dolichyl-phosphate-mannose-protein mannosyltransferase